MSERLFIALVGLDGTGKSTQAERLQSWLAAQGAQAEIVHHCSPLMSPVRAVKKRLHGAAVRELKKRGVHPAYGDAPRVRQRGLSRVAGEVLGCGFITTGFLKSWYHRARHGQGLIYDRCLIDDIVKAKWRFGGGWWFGSRLLRLVPRPDIVFYFQLDPVVAHSRKKALTCDVEELRAKESILEAGIELARRSGWRVDPISIDGLSADEVSERVRVRLVSAGVARGPRAA